MRVVILVPRREGFPDRDRLWSYARARWASDHPTWPIFEGHHDEHEGPFNRAAAINRAAAAAGDWDVAVIIDADVLIDPHVVRSVVDTAACTGAMVVSGHERRMLSAKATEQILAGYHGSWDVPGFVRVSYFDQCSCCVGVSRALWDSVGGFDELHVGWGWEDVSFQYACQTMSGKRMIEVSHQPIWHLHHAPPKENNHQAPTTVANRARFDRYLQAHGDRAVTQLLIDEHLAARTRRAEVLPVGAIPRILHRTLPAHIDQQVEAWWEQFAELHPGWDLRTWREPLDPASFPLTADLWPRCVNGAQRAGLVRLELLVSHGGVYVDSDVAPFRSLEPLLDLQAFGCWEDRQVVPDFVLGARPHHPAFELALAKARSVIEGGGDAWQSGPGVTTEVLPGRDDVLLLPPGAFAPFHYLERSRAAEVNADPPPYAFAAHQWHGSWLSPEQRASIESRQRV